MTTADVTSGFRTDGADRAGLSIVEIRRMLPHRYPMLMVDRVLELVPGDRIVAVKAVTCNEPCYAGLADDVGPEAFEYPSSLLVESWGQSAALLAVTDKPAPEGQVMLAGAMTDIELFDPVLPGDVLRHEARLLRALDDTLIFEGESHVGDRLVASYARMVMAFRPSAEMPG